MTRVLQVRRGNAAQNNDFTGLVGEITMDTDAKTLRIHDGETLGGFALARADNAATNTGTFDINSVPDDFWAELIKNHANAVIPMTETTPCPINSQCSYLDYIVGGNEKPRWVQVALICQNPDAGYAIGDEVWAFGIGSRANPMPNWTINQDGLHLCLMVGHEKYWASHRDTGITTELADENWRILFRVYY